MKHTQITILTTFLWLTLFSLATAGDIQVTARLNQQEIYLGQPFALTIIVENADDVIQPDLSKLSGFQTKFLGQSQNSSTQIFNGHRESTKTTELNYQFTAQRSVTTIPAITVIADNKEFQTRPIPVTLKQPEENDHFKLEVRLSKPIAYVGEPLLMTTTWLIGQKARGGGFNLPVMSDNRFKTSVRNDLLPRDQKQLIRIELAGEVILAKQHQKRVGNQDFTAITFFHTLIPQTTGELTLPQGTIAMDALSGYQTAGGGRNRDPFASWGSRQREIYNTIVVPANPVSLTVRPLPQHDVPPSFNGLVGQYSIKASAEPLTVNVGDPITLQLEIGGEAANSVTMPNLTFDRFKISNDPVKQSATDDAITFTTTIRARNEEVTEIPGIPLSFFNVESGQYETVHTTPIPITVRATRIITADDA
ncbi:MAG: BatD family protein, partial [Desulfobulbaceae bacterium]|nr:BatD family protein [Desulfobulbaceae bacterium]